MAVTNAAMRSADGGRRKFTGIQFPKHEAKAV
jgi:hypothetical protein